MHACKLPKQSLLSKVFLLSGVSAMKPDVEAVGASPHVPASPRKHEEAPLDRRISALLIGAFIAGVLLAILLPDLDRHQIPVPTFSLDLAGFDGLDGPAPLISPAFNLTLHGVSSSRRISESCEYYNERGTVAVSYGGAVLAWGRAPEFCVAEGAQKRVRMAALGGGVALSDELRGRMASERRWRSAEVDVDVVLESYMDGWKKYLSCRVKLDAEVEPSQQPSPCRVLASHLW